MEGEGSDCSSVSKGGTVENFFPAEGLLVALGGFSLGFLVALGGFSLGFLVALGGFSLGFLVALGGFSFGFFVGLVEPSMCFAALGPLSFFPFFSLSLFFCGGTVKDKDEGTGDQEPNLCAHVVPLDAQSLGVRAPVSPWSGMDQEAKVSHLLKW